MWNIQLHVHTRTIMYTLYTYMYRHMYECGLGGGGGGGGSFEVGSCRTNQNGAATGLHTLQDYWLKELFVCIWELGNSGTALLSGENDRISNITLTTKIARTLLDCTEKGSILFCGKDLLMIINLLSAFAVKNIHIEDKIRTDPS